jgi:hypothetical protein
MEIKLNIRPQTIKEEYHYLWWLLGEIPFLKENNYTFEFPEHPTFLKLAEISPKCNKKRKNELFNLFKEEVYDPDFFKNGIITLKSYRQIFDKAIPRFIEMNQKWGFKIFPKYDILLTRYGVGGNYYPGQGIVIIMADIDGNFKKFDPLETMIHEIIHIGIGENITDHFKLTHWEEERIVDLICILKFKDILPKYPLQEKSSKKIDSYIKSVSIDQLPKAIEKYITDFPR